jgi:putative transposase
MPFWALMASGQMTRRKIDGWQTLSTPMADRAVALAA